jgi:hypothetical protein
VIRVWLRRRHGRRRRRTVEQPRRRHGAGGEDAVLGILALFEREHCNLLSVRVDDPVFGNARLGIVTAFLLVVNVILRSRQNSTDRDFCATIR